MAGVPSDEDAVNGTLIWPEDGDVAVPMVGAVGAATTVVAADAELHTSPGATPLFETVWLVGEEKEGWKVVEGVGRMI